MVPRMKRVILLGIMLSLSHSQVTVNHAKRNTLDESRLQEELRLLKEEVRLLKEEQGRNKDDGQRQIHGGLNFVNWGRTVCPVNTSTIYRGIAAKTMHSREGGGVNYLCLPEDPEFTGNEVAGLQTNSYIHGVEIWAKGLPNIFPDEYNYNDMPCAVCDVPYVSQTLMIPTKLSCPMGWSLLYQGILMAARTEPHHTSASNYICVDKDYEFLDGGVANEDSGYAIPVEAVCGIIPCPPYTNGYELSCVVCIK